MLSAIYLPYRRTVSILWRDHDAIPVLRRRLRSSPIVNGLMALGSRAIVLVILNRKILITQALHDLTSEKHCLAEIRIFQ